MDMTNETTISITANHPIAVYNAVSNAIKIAFEADEQLQARLIATSLEGDGILYWEGEGYYAYEACERGNEIDVFVAKEFYEASNITRRSMSGWSSLRFVDEGKFQTYKSVYDFRTE